MMISYSASIDCGALGSFILIDGGLIFNSSLYYHKTRSINTTYIKPPTDYAPVTR